MVLNVQNVVLTSNLWMKSYGVTFQIKPLHQYFLMVISISDVVLSTFESVDEMLVCYHASETSSAVLALHGTLYLEGGSNF